MACRHNLDPFSVSAFMPPRIIKFLFKTDTGFGSVQVPYFSVDTKEFTGLEDFYGTAFLKHVVPDFYGFQSNVVKVKEFIETRQVNFEGLREFDKQSVRLLLTKWQDSGSSLKLRRFIDPKEAFKRAAAFSRLCDLFSIQGFKGCTNSALSRLRQRNSVLILIEPAGILLHRRPDTVNTMKPLTEINHKYYYKRPGTKAFLRRMQEEPYCQVGFYSSYETSKLDTLFKNTKPKLRRLTENFMMFGRRHCSKALSNGKPMKDLSRIWQTSWARKHRFEAHNTVHLDWSCEATREYASNVLLASKFDEHALLHCPSRRGLEHLRTYLKGMLERYEFDVRVYLQEKSFVPYS
mmetsp:Transcript_8062/g.15856  ORF Transcript_8062/g.15856 Transcript_8062/m.15856 type:complete len:349 (-) Transcript_8062:388-1434(-)